MHDATKSRMGKDLFKVQNRSMNFKVRAYLCCSLKTSLIRFQIPHCN